MFYFFFFFFKQKTAYEIYQCDWSSDVCSSDLEIKEPKSWKNYAAAYGLTGRDYKRELIRRYFDYTCQKCGRVWHKGERRFDVHHFSCSPVDSRKYDKDVDFNAVTLLCHKCHMSLPEHRKAMMKPHLFKRKSKRLDKFL